MPSDRPLPFTRLDAVLLIAFAILGVLVVVATDHEYAGILRLGLRKPFEERSWSLWPSWLQHWSWSALRPWLDGLAALGVAGTGLAVATYRHRRGWRRGRSRAGHIAAATTVLLALFWVLMTAFDHWISPLIPLPPNATRGKQPSYLYYTYWTVLGPLIAWAIAGAWITLALTGGRRPPIDWADRFGRWLGWGWIGSAFCHGIMRIINIS